MPRGEGLRRRENKRTAGSRKGRMNAGTNGAHAANTMRHGNQNPGTRDLRGRSLPTKNGHAGSTQAHARATRLDEVAGYILNEVAMKRLNHKTRSKPQREVASHGAHCHRSR